MFLIDESTKNQFSIFCKENKPKDMETAIEYFTVFGGLDIKVDTTKPLADLIEKHILKDYDFLKYKIHTLTGGYRVDHAVLTGIALGDRKTTTSFKRAHVSFEEGMKCVENLTEKGIIEIESSQNFILKKRGNTKVAKKLLFTTPFLRFWFAFVSPIYKGIKEGNFEEFNSRYNNRKAEFTDFIFDELCMETLIDTFTEDPISKFGKYWDDDIEISLVAKTKSGKIFAGNCKYTNSKLKKSELTKLKEDCQKIDLNADKFVIFTKKGFTSELKSMKSDEIKLLTAKNIKILTED